MAAIAIEAARLAQITGKPVQVSWTRAEEFFNATFDSAAVVKNTSGADQAGRISLWDYTVYAAGVRGTTLSYATPNARIRSAGNNGDAPAAEGASVHPFATGPWRGPGANMSVFAAESQIDIMASALGVDPLEFRLRDLADARMIRVLKAAASPFDRLPRGIQPPCQVEIRVRAAARQRAAAWLRNVVTTGWSETLTLAIAALKDS